MGARHESQLEEATRTVSADQAALSAAREALAESEAETAKLREQLSSRAGARESQAQAVQAVRCHNIAAVWVAFFSRQQRYCC